MSGPDKNLVPIIELDTVKPVPLEAPPFPTRDSELRDYVMYLLTKKAMDRAKVGDDAIEVIFDGLEDILDEIRSRSDRAVSRVVLRLLDRLLDRLG